VSWLSDITDSVGGVFGYGDLSSQISDFLPGNTSGGSTVVPSPDPGQKGDGFFNSTAFYSSLLNAGLGLAGTYFQQSGQKELAEAAAKQRLAEIEAASKLKAGGGGGGGGGAGAALKIAKMNNMAALYQNWANLTQKGGADAMEGSIATGKLMTEPINVRLAALR